MHGFRPGFKRHEADFRAGQLCVQGFVIGEFLGEEKIRQAVLFSRAFGGQRIGIALAFVRAGALGNAHKALVDGVAQERVQTTKRQANRLGGRALWRIRGDIQLPQKAEKLVFFAADMFLSFGHDTALIVCSRVNVSHKSVSEPSLV